MSRDPKLMFTKKLRHNFLEVEEDKHLQWSGKRARALYVREIECSWNLELQKDMWPTQSLSRDGRRPALRIQFQYTLSIMHGVLGMGDNWVAGGDRTGPEPKKDFTSCSKKWSYVDLNGFLIWHFCSAILFGRKLCY